jgi:hypothetical protein
LAYPRGPMGVHTYMVRLAPSGRLLGIENAMDPGVFARVESNMTMDAVARLLGPPVGEWSEYFPARDELVRGWRYCDDWHQLSRFYVLFDGTTRLVRSTMTQTEGQARSFGNDSTGNWCSR